MKEEYQRKKRSGLDIDKFEEFLRYFSFITYKDGKFEYQFLALLGKLEPKENKLLILDDIRFVNMTDLWISILSPKLDISSFGHWSGTGLVDISKPLQLVS